MKESLADVQLQQAILSSSQNTDVRTKMKENEVNVDFRQQLNAVQNSIPLSNLNLHSLTDSIGVENKDSHFISGQVQGQGQGDKQNFHHEKINGEKILNKSIHIDRQKSKESKNNLSSFLSETNFSKEDLMDIFAKAIAGATTSSTSATTSSTPATTSYARSSAPIILTKEVQMGKTPPQISTDPNDHSHASLNAFNESSNSISHTVLSDEFENSDSDNDNYHDYDKRLSETPTRTTTTTATTIEKQNFLSESYKNPNLLPLIPQRDYHGDLGSSVAADESSNRNVVDKFDAQDEIFFHEEFNKKKILHVRQASLKEEGLESNNSPKHLNDQSQNRSISETQKSNKTYDPTTSTSSTTTAAEEVKLSGRRSIPFNGGTVKWTDESDYQSRQSYPPPANKGNLHQNNTGREMYSVGKTVKGVLKGDEEEGDVGLYHNTANDNAKALQAARESSGVYGPYGYKDSALKRTEGNIYPNTSYYLHSHLARYCTDT